MGRLLLNVPHLALFTVPLERFAPGGERGPLTMTPGNTTELRRQVPAVGSLLSDVAFEDLLGRHPRALVVEELRHELQQVRADLEQHALTPDRTSATALAARVSRRMDERSQPYYRRVINGSGIVLHTGLGRARLPASAVDAIARTGGGAVRLELDLESGARGGRDGGSAVLLRTLIGCDDATVVNNNAAATLLILAALARGKRVIVSRGELVEIGGSYRIPDVLRESGGILTEIGTTNRTHLSDYANAIGADAGMILKVHTSNYRIEGFSHEVSIEDLAALGRAHAVPVVHDLGSGCLVGLQALSGCDEPGVARSVRAGADLVCFSGDKLLGGPQAGIIAGTASAVGTCRRHPLYRVLRPGRLTYVALEATLRIYEQGEQAAFDAIPSLRDLTAPPALLKRRASSLASRLRRIVGVECDVVQCESLAGGGSMPATPLPSWGVAIAAMGVPADALATALRHGDPPVIARIRDDRVLIDARTVEPSEMVEIERSLRGVVLEQMARPAAPG
jgi:L-seryl-tRNA(Ser) seleniumtransferase